MTEEQTKRFLEKDGYFLKNTSISNEGYEIEIYQKGESLFFKGYFTNLAYEYLIDGDMWTSFIGSIYYPTVEEVISRAFQLLKFEIASDCSDFLKKLEYICDYDNLIKENS
jgi:hypothetical protein